MLLVIHYITPSQNHPQMPWSTWRDFTTLWDNPALKHSGWAGAPCTGLKCTFLWVICIFTRWWNWPIFFLTYSLNLWIQMSAKYAWACQNPELGRDCRYSLLHQVRLEGLTDIVDSSCDTQWKDEPREIFLPKDGAEQKGFPFSFHFENVPFFRYLYVSVSIVQKWVCSDGLIICCL